MKKIIDLLLIILVFLLVFLLNSCNIDEWENVKEDINKNRDVTLTVYNSDLGLVREVRKIDFNKGKQSVKFYEVAQFIDPTSVHFTSLSFPKTLSILEQNYEFDVINSDKLLNKYIDMTIKLYITDTEAVTGTLLSTGSGVDSSKGGIIIKDDENNIKVYNISNIKHLSFPYLPKGLLTRPTLVWNIDSSKDGEHKVEVSYLTTGMNWHSEYVALINENDDILDLNAWVSVENNSGANYDNASIKLIAGDVKRILPLAAEVQDDKLERNGYAKSPAKEEKQFEQKAFFEYYMYTLNRRSDVNNSQIKQISLFPTTKVKLNKVYFYDASIGGNKKVDVNLEFKNSKENNLGIALPKGKIRVYKSDKDKSQIFIGEDQIEHTPENEEIKLNIGKAFDIVGEWQNTDYKSISNVLSQEAFKITLKNKKDIPIEIVVNKSHWGDWKIVSTTDKYTKKDSGTIEFRIKLKAKEEKDVTYTVQSRY